VVIRRTLVGGLALALAMPARALSLNKPTGEVRLRFEPGEARLSDAQRAMLDGLLPKLRMISLEVLVVEACFSNAGRPGWPSETLAKQRLAAIVGFFNQAGIPAERVVPLPRALESMKSPYEDSRRDDVDVGWAGHCLPEHPGCYSEYFGDRGTGVTERQRPSR
jgi:hypothetical protein